MTLKELKEMLTQAFEARKAIMSAIEKADTGESLDKAEMDLRKNQLIIQNLQEQIAQEEAKEPQDDPAARSFSNQPTGAGKLNPVATFRKAPEGTTQAGAVGTQSTADDEDIYNSTAYRKAFMSYVLRKEPIPVEYRADAVTKTSDVGTVIPTTIVQRIIEKLEAVGMILPLISKMSIKGGVEIPTSSTKPVATWVAEGSGSDKQKDEVKTKISFTYHKLRCAISMTLETSVVTLEVFEANFIAKATTAMVKAKEQAIINGSGVGQPKGILTETAPTGQTIEIASGSTISYSTLVAAEGALPIEYEGNAQWCMTKKTFMRFIGMTDSVGQPIARTNYGIAGKPERTLLGRSVVLCNYISSYADTVASDTCFAFLFDFQDYALNSNYEMTVKQYEDNATDDLVTKLIELVDGKVTDVNSLVKLIKKA